MLEGVFDLRGGDAFETAVASHRGVLLGDGKLGDKEGAECVEAEEQVATRHDHIDARGDVYHAFGQLRVRW